MKARISDSLGKHPHYSIGMCLQDLEDHLRCSFYARTHKEMSPGPQQPSRLSFIRCNLFTRGTWAVSVLAIDPPT